MTYRSLLVLLDTSPLCLTRIEFSIQLAQTLGARLTGWAPVGISDLPGSASPFATPQDARAIAEDALHQNAVSVVQAFMQACNQAGLRDANTLLGTKEHAWELTHLTHGHDMLIVPQADAASASQTRMRLLVEQVILQCARPVLVVPRLRDEAFDPSKPLDVVTIAWDDGREAARAASDALPLLRLAKRIHAITLREWMPFDDPEPSAAGLQRLQEWLRHHGLSVETHNLVAKGNLGVDLMARVTELGSDLLVMGAWSQARWAQRMLGGTTQSVLRSARVAALLSH